MLRYFVLVILALPLAGCMLGPDFESAPQFTEANETFRVPDNYAPAPENVSFAEHEWQQVYRDEKLQQLLEQGLKNNLDLKAARIRLAQAHAERTRARAPLFPDVALEGTGGREQGSKLSKPDAKISEEFVLEGVLSWELDVWGVNRRAAEVAEADLEATKYRLYGQQISLIAAIAETYFDLQYAIDRQKITGSTIESRQKALHILKLRREAGIISGLDVRQAEVSLAQAQNKLPAIDVERVHLENALRILLGEKPGVVDIPGSVNTKDLPTQIPVGLPSELLERRPDIKIAEAELHAATASIGIARGALFPSFSLTASYGRLSPELNDLLDSRGKIWTLEGAMLQPIFNAGANLANLEIVELEQDVALINYNKTLLTAFAEVSDALHGYYSAYELLLSARNLASSSREYLRLAQLQYGNGVLNYLDVLDAQRQLFDAEISLSDAQNVRLKAVVELYKALGGGWQESSFSG